MGLKSSEQGNFSVPNMKYLICDEKTNVIFTSLMFDYEKLIQKYKIMVNNKLYTYFDAIDKNLLTKSQENTGYDG